MTSAYSGQGVCVDPVAVFRDERFHAVACDAQADDALVRGGVILPEPFNHAVEAVPEMDVRHGQQPDVVGIPVYPGFERDTPEVDAVGNADRRRPNISVSSEKVTMRST